MFTETLHILKHLTLGDILDIILVAFILYSLILLVKDAKAFQLAIGISLIGILYLASKWGRLAVSNWLIKNFVNYLIIAIIVLFQGEIRRFLTGLGSRTFRKPWLQRSLEEKIDDISLAVEYLSSKKIGALIAIEKEISLKSYADRGTKVDAHLSTDLLVNIFYPHTPLHDGAVIIQGQKIASAGCLLPLPATHIIGKEFKARTRHLSALGLSAETDAAVVVVSEESGMISLAVKGKLRRFKDSDELKTRLVEYLRDK